MPLPSVAIYIMDQSYKKEAYVKYKKTHFTLIQSI